MPAYLHNLMEAIDKSERSYDKEQIVRAYEFAKSSHEGQLRDSGEPYISHPIAVSSILVELGMDEASICAALLHDVVEDTPVTKEQLASMFGVEVANMVDGVTKLSKIPLSTREEQQAENVRKMLFAMSEDIRVIIIKLADRLHNMRTLKFRPPQKQRDTALETMEIYAPIAHRLGIRAVKEELEDLALQYLDPVALHEIEDTLQLKEANRKFFIPSIIDRIGKRLEEYNITPKIEGRVKSLFGIYRKVYTAGRDFDEVYDIYAVRIITSTVIECYNILGIMHDMFTPIPNRFKDYISTPKANMYQSLHTTVLSKEGIPFEIQIRTWDMHYTAEYGIAAHWKYKLGIQGKDRQEERFAWIRRLIESQQENESPEEIVYNIKNDLGAEDVFVFTPKGDVKNLPVGSTVIDFAYAIHSAVGNRMTGAKVNGRIVPIDYKVKTGDVVEIITGNSQNHGPNRGWLNIVKTSEARNKIRAWFKKERRTENIAQGKEEIEREFKRNQITLPEKEMEEFLLAVSKRLHCNSVDDFYASIGYGGILLSKIMPRLKDEYLKNYRPKPAEPEQPVVTEIPKSSYKGSSGVIVDGIGDCLVKFSQCCTPLPGDPIIGFITRGHGVSIHKQDCVNVLASMKNDDQRDRWIPVHWVETKETYYRCTLDIVAHDRNGLLADVTVELAGGRVPVHEVFARELKNGNANIVVTIGIAGVDQLKNIVNKLSKVRGVISVERSGKQ